MPRIDRKRILNLRPVVEGLEIRSLMTTVIPFQPPHSNPVVIAKPDLYLFTGNIIKGASYHPIFAISDTIPTANTAQTISINLDPSSQPYLYAQLNLNTVAQSGVTVSNFHNTFNTNASNNGNNTPVVINLAPNVRFTYSFTISLGNYSIGYTPPPPATIPFTVQVNIAAASTIPHVAIVSFVKDSAANPLSSNGDYDLTYQVSTANLPNNLNPTLGAYWATGTTAESIIQGIPPVATGPLNHAIGSYVFPVHIAQLINPPVNATNLVAVLDNSHVLPASEETNSIAFIESGVLHQSLSYELDSIAPSLAVAVTREQRVFLWIAKYATSIKSTASVYGVDPRAIAGAIAWEALQNVQGYLGLLYNGYGPGKIHPSGDAHAVEGTNRYGHYLTIQPGLLNFLQDPDHAITYIAAMMNAYAVNAKSVGIDLRAATNPTPQDTGSSNAGILASYYNGVSFNGQQVTLANAATYFANRVKTLSTQPLSHNLTMGRWVDHNLTWLGKALGTA